MISAPHSSHAATSSRPGGSGRPSPRSGPSRWSAPSRQSFLSFAKRYCDAQHNGYGWVTDGASNLGGLREELPMIENGAIHQHRTDLSEAGPTTGPASAGRVTADTPYRSSRLGEPLTNGAVRFLDVPPWSSLFERFSPARGPLQRASPPPSRSSLRTGTTLPGTADSALRCCRRGR